MDFRFATPADAAALAPMSRQLMVWLRQHAWPTDTPVRLDVLAANTAAQRVWQAVGFADYCITMELAPRQGTA